MQNFCHVLIYTTVFSVLFGVLCWDQGAVQQANSDCINRGAYDCIISETSQVSWLSPLGHGRNVSQAMTQKFKSKYYSRKDGSLALQTNLAFLMTHIFAFHALILLRHEQNTVNAFAKAAWIITSCICPTVLLLILLVDICDKVVKQCRAIFGRRGANPVFCNNILSSVGQNGISKDSAQSNHSAEVGNLFKMREKLLAKSTFGGTRKGESLDGQHREY